MPHSLQGLLLDWEKDGVSSHAMVLACIMLFYCFIFTITLFCIQVCSKINSFINSTSGRLSEFKCQRLRKICVYVLILFLS